MKSILMSIQPKWCEKIFNGEKTIEVRKSAPKPPFKVVVYETKGRKRKFYDRDLTSLDDCERAYFDYDGCGKVIGEFICNKVEAIPVDSEAFATISKSACLTIDELIEYCSGKDMYGLHITDPILYDKPKELGEFRKADRKNPTCGYSYCCKAYCGSYDYCTAREVTRPPQSYMRIQCTEEEQ